MARGAWASKNNSSSVQFVTWLTWKSNEINTLCGSPEVRTFLELERFGAWRQVVVSESWVEWFPIQRNPGFWISKGFLRGRHCRSLVEAGAVRSRFLQSQERTWKTRKTLLIYFQALQRKHHNDLILPTKSPSLHSPRPLSNPRRTPAVKPNGHLVRARMGPKAWGSRKLCSSSICADLVFVSWMNLLRSEPVWNVSAPDTQS